MVLVYYIYEKQPIKYTLFNQKLHIATYSQLLVA